MLSYCYLLHSMRPHFLSNYISLRRIFSRPFIGQPDFTVAPKYCAQRGQWQKVFFSFSFSFWSSEPVGNGWQNDNKDRCLHRRWTRRWSLCVTMEALRTARKWNPPASGSLHSLAEESSTYSCLDGNHWMCRVHRQYHLSHDPDLDYMQLSCTYSLPFVSNWLAFMLIALSWLILLILYQIIFILVVRIGL